MSTLEAIIMGLIQGLTEYLPVSSSGHLAIAGTLFGLSGEDNLSFTIAVHVATVLATLVVLWREVVWLFKGLFRWDGHLNEAQRYILCIVVSMMWDCSSRMQWRRCSVPACLLWAVVCW